MTVPSPCTRPNGRGLYMSLSSARNPCLAAMELKHPEAGSFGIDREYTLVLSRTSHSDSKRPAPKRHVHQIDNMRCGRFGKRFLMLYWRHESLVCDTMGEELVI